MAADPDIDRSAIWPDQILNPYARTPSALSVRSTSSAASSDSIFSIDAPSSQSSVSSASIGWSCSRLEDEEESREQLRGYSTQIQRSSLKDILKENVHSHSQRTCSPPLQQSQTSVLPRDARLNPRRTQRLNLPDAQSGKPVSHPPRPPPALVHSSERKVNFVDTLVDTTTQMVETIWPLSAYVQTNHSVLCSRQPSKMDLRYFIQEVLRRSKTSYSTLQVALYYLILIRSCLPTLDFTMEQPEDSPRSFSLQCGRRMFISALILASKYLQDRNFSANAWSKISGLSTWDLNVNEMAFLSTINWKLHIPGQVFDRWVDIVLKYSPSSPPRSSPKPTISWKDVVLRLTPDLDTIDFGGAELSDDSGYDSPGSDMSPPPIPIRDEIVSRSNEPTPTPSCSIPQWLEQTPSRVQEQRPTLPPLQPHLAPLPTPDLTPQIGPFSTPAVSAQGMSTRRSSMSQTMRQIQEASLARSTLDHTSEWKPRVSHGFPTLDRRTSLTTSASSMSSPESMSDVLTQFSDASSRPSRSSSISSVASSNCAPPQPTRLAVQATRRCANMQLNGLTEEVHQSGNREPPKRVSSMEFVCKPGADALRVTKPSPKESDHIFQEDKRTRPLGNAMREASHMIGEDAVKLNPAATRQTGRSESFNGDCFTTYQRQKHLRKLPHSFAAPATADNEAAAALQELALNYQQGSTARPRSTDSSRKRARPNSMDLSVEDAVRNLIAPRCLNDITNQQRINRNEKDSTVIADDCCADSFVLRKENKHASKEAHKRSTKAAPLSRDGQPRKRPCAVAGSNRGGREEARLLERMVAQRSGRSTGMREAGIR